MVNWDYLQLSWVGVLVNADFRQRTLTKQRPTTPTLVFIFFRPPSAVSRTRHRRPGVQGVVEVIKVAWLKAGK